MATIEEIDVQEDSGMGSSDIHSPEIKSILPDDEEDEEVITIIVIKLNFTNTNINKSLYNNSVRYITNCWMK